ncbi:hypothetical protein N7492_001684 [Penicillium capsulatum]|uniref:AB hydrolase-1 domain-containing protein n=1 Tax=Penicillium capsulatum TaxID=69766 RepID=A0A9W9ITQ0_9EURO|nr:hypothetical protein N7492_001684 [Penicillium capsulatum]KAJ6129265.1 hypothetical protein N7512_002045 [Penicillium capsulatum]
MTDDRDGANGPLPSLSLPPPLPARPRGNKRRLLLIYIHGFMGSEASFHDLPVHVHDLLTALLGESHVVYTRIYPRYKSHGEIGFAAEQFSAWLSPHEAGDLDVILLGHSLGGIVAADVALLQKDGRPRHRILGLVNFDVPFLGLHPRVIPTGIGSSMPKKDPATEEKLADQQESIGLEPAFQPPPNPTFNQPWKNDVRLVDRGFLKGVMHFVNKNTDNLSRSIYDRVMSSMKHAGCVNNYTELRQRWRRLKELEEAEMSPERVRFINYYTASTGRISQKTKTRPVKDTEEDGNEESATSTPNETPDTPEPSNKNDDPPREPSETPSIHAEETATPEADDETTTEMDQLTLQAQEPRPMTPESDQVTEKGEEKSDADEANGDESDKPTDSLTETSTPSSINKEENYTPESVSLSTTDSNLSGEPAKPKLRKFILLPSHHWKYDNDAHWTPILMEDMDEVAAHQSMFIPQGKNYDHLVGDCVALIEQWVQADLSGRLVRESFS